MSSTIGRKGATHAEAGRKGGLVTKLPEERRTVVRGVRLTEEEDEEIRRRAEAEGLRLSEYLRRRVLLPETERR